MNGKAERLNNTIVERLRAVMLEYRFRKALWDELLMALFFLRNRSPTADGTATPYEPFYGQKPDDSHLRVLGSSAYALRPDHSYFKLSAKTLLGTFVGYVGGGYVVHIRSSVTAKILVRRDVVVDETVPAIPVPPTAMPVCLFLLERCTDSQSTTFSGDVGDGGDLAVSGNGGDGGAWDVSAGGNVLGASIPPRAGDGGRLADADGAATTVRSPPAGGSSSPDVFVAPPPGGDGWGHGYFLRHRHDSNKPGPSALAANVTPPPAPLVPMAVDKTVANPDWFATPPTTRAEALARPDAYLWQQAINDEMAALRAAHAWELLGLPSGGLITGGRWVFNHKRDANGIVTRYKARGRCARLHSAGDGGLQRRVGAMPGARYGARGHGVVCGQRLGAARLRHEDSLPQCPHGRERVLAAARGVRGGSHGDGCPPALRPLRAQAGGAAVRESLPRDADGHRRRLLDGRPNDVRLAAPRARAELHTRTRGRHGGHGQDVGGRVGSQGGGAVCVRGTRPGGVQHVPRHAGRPRSSGGHSEAQLPGCHRGAVGAVRNGRRPTQKASDGVQDKFDADGGAPAGGQHAVFGVYGQPSLPLHTTRPDISYAAGVLARSMNNPEDQHWMAAKGVLRYLSGTADYGLCYGPAEELAGAVDADLGGCPETRR